MSNTSAGSPGRTPLSMQTEYAKQQQLITVGMLFLLLGPISLIVAGVLAGMVGRDRRRMAWCALGGTIALAVAGWFWHDYRAIALALWATVSDAYSTLQAGQRAGGTIAYGQLALLCWPPLWAWWRMSLLAAPLV